MGQRQSFGSINYSFGTLDNASSGSKPRPPTQTKKTNQFRTQHGEKRHGLRLVALWQPVKRYVAWNSRVNPCDFLAGPIQPSEVHVQPGVCLGALVLWTCRRRGFCSWPDACLVPDAYCAGGEKGQKRSKEETRRRNGAAFCRQLRCATLPLPNLLCCLIMHLA